MEWLFFCCLYLYHHRLRVFSFGLTSFSLLCFHQSSRKRRRCCSDEDVSVYSRISFLSSTRTRSKANADDVVCVDDVGGEGTKKNSSLSLTHACSNASIIKVRTKRKRRLRRCSTFNKESRRKETRVFLASPRKINNDMNNVVVRVMAPLFASFFLSSFSSLYAQSIKQTIYLFPWTMFISAGRSVRRQRLNLELRMR